MAVISKVKKNCAKSETFAQLFQLNSSESGGAVIKDLNAKDVYVLYVYDALMCEEKDREHVIETMNRIILEHDVKTRVKVNSSDLTEPTFESLQKYALNEMVNLYDILPQLSFDVEDTLKIISGIDNSNVEMAELLDYLIKQTAQHKYNDYDGVEITASMISKLKILIKP